VKGFRTLLVIRHDGDDGDDDKENIVCRATLTSSTSWIMLCVIHCGKARGVGSPTEGDSSRAHGNTAQSPLITEDPFSDPEH